MHGGVPRAEKIEKTSREGSIEGSVFARSAENPPHPAKDGRRVKLLHAPRLYSLDSSFAIGLAHATVL